MERGASASLPAVRGSAEPRWEDLLAGGRVPELRGAPRWVARECDERLAIRQEGDTGHAVFTKAFTLLLVVGVLLLAGLQIPNADPVADARRNDRGVVRTNRHV